MRIWLLALASCWTGPVAPAPVVMPRAVPVAVRPALKPGGYFVQDLIAHRLETRAFEEMDLLDGELAVFASYPASPVRSRRPRSPGLVLSLGSRFTGSTLPNLNNLGVDARLVIEYCIDVTGRVASAHFSSQGDVRPLNVAAPSDHDVLESLRGWLFTPYFVDGKPVMACSFIDYSTIAP
jgi:hypothetical protein